jgi:hypothetical protein
LKCFCFCFRFRVSQSINYQSFGVTERQPWPILSFFVIRNVYWVRNPCVGFSQNSINMQEESNLLNYSVMVLWKWNSVKSHLIYFGFQ